MVITDIVYGFLLEERTRGDNWIKIGQIWSYMFLSLQKNPSTEEINACLQRLKKDGLVKSSTRETWKALTPTEIAEKRISQVATDRAKNQNSH